MFLCVMFSNISLSPTFWVAVSFFIFIVFAWSFLRSAFLNVINKYRNEISSSLGNLYMQKDESRTILERSNQELSDSSFNSYVLNAHKVAKNILDASKERIAILQHSMNQEINVSAMNVEQFLAKKTQEQILSQVSELVELYLSRNPLQFDQIAVKNVIIALKQVK
jgi:F0F1-type ATP synthase membrane subunit b/b'